MVATVLGNYLKNSENHHRKTFGANRKLLELYLKNKINNSNATKKDCVVM